MKLLLDERLPLDFRYSLPNHEAHTAEWAGLKGTKNGELLRIAEIAGYEVLLTVDQGVPPTICHPQAFEHPDSIADESVGGSPAV
jgi:hypothetical protein